MKATFVLLCLVGASAAQFLSPDTLVAGGAPRAAAPAAANGAGNSAGNGAGNPHGATSKYGPRVYGMGLNNPWAFPVNPFMMNRAVALLNQTPGALLRVDVDGSLTFTNQFGQEIDIVDRFGNDISDHFE